MKCNRKTPEVNENIVFTPFDEPGLEELRSWLLKDSPAEIRSAFGPHMLAPSGVNNELLRSLLTFDSGESPETISMMATIRTSYHTLIHIGYVQLKQSVQAGRNCYINHVYLSKPFRQKDYEYSIFRRLVEFAVKDLRCDRCLIWIPVHNYLFLSIARTLGFRLVKMATTPAGTVVRYCYAVTSAPEATAESKVPDMAIPNYIIFKRKLQMVNRLHETKSSPLQRRSAACYSPIVQDARMYFSRKKAELNQSAAAGTANMDNSPSALINSKEKRCCRYESRCRNVVRLRGEEIVHGSDRKDYSFGLGRFVSPNAAAGRMKPPFAEKVDVGRSADSGKAKGSDCRDENIRPGLAAYTKMPPLPDIVRHRQELLKF